MRGMLIAGPNLTIDRTLAIAELRPGEVLRFDRVVVTPGGKGLNVAPRRPRARRTRAVLVSLLPGRTGEAAAALIADEGIELHAVAVRRRAALDLDHPGARRPHDRAQRARAAGRPARVGRLRARDRGSAWARTACSSARAACRPAARPTPTAGWSALARAARGADASSTPRARRCCARSTPRPASSRPNLAEAEAALGLGRAAARPCRARPDARPRALAAAEALVRAGRAVGGRDRRRGGRGAARGRRRAGSGSPRRGWPRSATRSAPATCSPPRWPPRSSAASRSPRPPARGVAAASASVEHPTAGELDPRARPRLLEATIA